MPPIEPTELTAPPLAPTREDSANFRPRSNAFIAWFSTMRTQMVAALANVYANAVDALASATAAASSASAAAASESASASNAAASASSAGAAPFAAGNYNAGVPARSNVNYRIYNARTSGAKASDPSADPTNWLLATAGGLPDVPYSGTAVTVSLNERSRFTNAAAVAATVPVPTRANEEWEGEWQNGRTDNSFNIGAANLRRNGVSDSGVITNSQRLIVRLISVGANEWRFKQ